MIKKPQKLLLIYVSIFLFSFLCISFLKNNVKAADSDWTYTTYGNNGIKITGYSGSDTVIEIPETLDGKTVLCLGESLFFEKSTITKITIPNTVIDIESSAFYGCKALTEINLPSGLTSINDTLFYNCRSLSKITIPSSVKSIGVMAFGSCYALNDLVIPNGVTSIRNQAFSHCSALTSIIIPNSVTSMGFEAFSSCDKLVSVQISTGLETIPNHAFADCSKLTSVVIPDNIITLESSAFTSCSNLSSVTLSKNLTSIGFYCFYGSAIESIVIPDSVTSLDADAFTSSKKISSVTLPCSFKDYSGFPEAATLTFTHPVGTITKATETANGIIKGCACGIEHPDTVIYHPSTIEVTSSECFYTGSAVEPSVTVKDINGTTIAADNYSVTYSNNINLGTANVTVTFKDNSTLYSGTLKETFKIYSPLSDFVYSTSETGVTITLYQGSSAVVVIPDVIEGKNVTAIGNSVFLGYSSITSITIPDSVTTIGNSVFTGCSGLTNIIIPNGVTSIGSYAFHSCSGLKTISIPNGVTTIGDYAFALCSGLTSITIPNGVTTIGNSAFYLCSGLKTINIPNGLTTIGNSAFSGCSNLTSITIPNGVTKIGDYAFASCSGLKTISIPNGLTTIGDSAFAGCSGLKEIIITSQVTTIGSEAFANCPNLTIYVDYANRIATVKEMTGIDNVVVCSHTGGTATHTTLAVCEKCGASYGETVPHNYTTEVDVKTKASSTTAGTVTKKCECGAEKDFTIAKPSKIELTQSSYTYTGSAIKPSVVVKDTDGKTISANNYTINYNNNIIGKATVSVTFKGNYYEGTLQTVSFTISLSKTSISSITNVATGITINWAKNSKATGYAIYRSVNNGAYTKLATVGTVTSYTDTKATTGGAKYAYKVVVLYKDSTGTTYTSDYSVEKSLTRIGKANITSVKNEVKGVTINWSKVSGANKYQVFRRTVGNGWVTGWTWLKDTTGTSFTDTTAENGKTYEYVVKPLCDKQNGVLSAGKTIKRVEAPKTITVAKATNGIKVTWAKVTGTTKYQVFRKTIGNGWETGWSWVKDTTGTTFTDTTAVKGKTYVYCVKAISTTYSSAYTTSDKFKY